MLDKKPSCIESQNTDMPKPVAKILLCQNVAPCLLGIHVFTMGGRSTQTPYGAHL